MATAKQKETAWENAAKVRGKDPDKYRRDPARNVMFKDSYGKTSPMGWEVDHIKPAARGGSDATVNLQALNTRVNRSKRDSLVKPSRHSK